MFSLLFQLSNNKCDVYCLAALNLAVIYIRSGPQKAAVVRYIEIFDKNFKELILFNARLIALCWLKLLWYFEDYLIWSFFYKSCFVVHCFLSFYWFNRYARLIFKKKMFVYVLVWTTSKESGQWHNQPVRVFFSWICTWCVFFEWSPSLN